MKKSDLPGMLAPLARLHRGRARHIRRDCKLEARGMTKGRLEAFSDGVIAVIITIMVLELKVPHDADPQALAPLIPVFLSYLLSFVFVGIYWNNHHHMFHAVHHVNGATLWANLHLLFWLSLVPFVTGWMDENHFAALPVAATWLCPDRRFEKLLDEAKA